MRRDADEQDWMIAALRTWLRRDSVLSSGCNKLKARDNINKGVNAFKTGQYTRGGGRVQDRDRSRSRSAGGASLSGDGLHEPEFPARKRLRTGERRGGSGTVSARC